MGIAEIYVYKFNELDEDSQNTAILNWFKKNDMSYSMADNETIQLVKERLETKEFFLNGHSFN